MEVEELLRLLNGEIVKVFDSKGAVQIKNNKFLAMVADNNKQQYILLNSYYTLENALLKIHNNI